MIWKRGLWLISSLCVVVTTAVAGPSYRSALKEATRHDRTYSLDNLEMRVAWSATYFSAAFRQARRSRLAENLEWSEEERHQAILEDERDLKKFDEFFVAIYAGSSSWPEVGKETGRWRFALQQAERAVRAVSIEKVTITEVERDLYPTLDKWSRGYRVRFPKILKDGEPFTLRMQGVPATSELHF